MSSQIAVIADAVVEYINDPARSYPESFAAIRCPTPTWDKDDLETLRVTVAGRSRRRSPLARVGFQRFVVVQIGIQKRLTQAADPKDETGNEEVDALMALGEAIQDSFTLQTDIGVSGARLLAEDSDELQFDPDHMRADGVFTAVITLTFTGI